MKMIAAYIQPFMTDKVTDALRARALYGVTVIPCQGFGHPPAGAEQAHRIEEAASLGFAPKTKIEIVCRDSDVRDVVNEIRQRAHTGHHGDGKIFVSDIGDAVDIRTGASGESAV